MNPPVTLEKLLDMWSKDSVIDETEPGRELLRIPNLHAKYLKINSYHNLFSKKIHAEYQEKRKVRWMYYDGKLNNADDMEKYGITEPMEYKIDKAQIPMHLDADPELSKILMQKAVHDEIVSCCSAIIKELNNRSWSIRGAIEWQKLTRGSS